jgi:hypothetical protein
MTVDHDGVSRKKLALSLLQNTRKINARGTLHQPGESVIARLDREGGVGRKPLVL